MTTKRYRSPKYVPDHVRTIEETAVLYDKLAASYERIASDDAKFLAERRRQGKP